MRIRVIQPPYPQCADDTPVAASFMIDQLKQCDESLDLILLPECCNAPSGCGDSGLLRSLVEKHTQPLLDAARETAVRCGATVGINLYVPGEGCGPELVRNTTLLFDSQGRIAGRYDKQQLPVSEYTNDYIDNSYLTDIRNPYCVEADGVRYAFLTCYDMYYTEYIHRVALEKPDVVLICSLQRAERSDILEMQAKNCAFVCNSFVVRSSYHMGHDSKTGGCSMIVAPDGIVLQNFGQGLGSFDCEIEDIHWKYCRSNGFGQPEVPNDVYISLYRTPWCYRASGSGVRPTNEQMTFPRVCAHRGFLTAAPENTIPSIGIAVALGASEVEIDIRSTSDGVPIVCHDSSVQRLTGEPGIISEMTYDDVRKLNLGKRFASCYDGITFASLEEVFAAFPRRTVFNLHIQPGEKVVDYRLLIKTITELATRYDCMEHIYFSCEDPQILMVAAEIAPTIERCLICQKGGQFKNNLVEAAQEYNCKRIQTVEDYLTDSQIHAAKELGIRCNLYFTENLLETKSWIDKGIDCILTDNFLSVSTELSKQ